MSSDLCRGRTSAGVSVEPLEPRRLLSVSTHRGWMILAPSDDTRTIYVSSSLGDDRNNGLSPRHPVKTLAHGRSLLRDAKPDHLLLKRGDRFKTGFGNLTVSGRSPDEPILIGTYGKGDRPVINSGLDQGIGTSRDVSHSVDNIVIDSLEFFPGKYDGSNGGYQTSGIHLVGQANHWLVEDCLIEGYKDDITLDARGAGVRNFTLRRSEILDAFCASPTVGNGHAQGIYVSGSSSNTLIEENVFDHNGWKERVTGAEPNWFNHAIYVNTGATGTVISGNIITRSSLRGVLLRAGGIVRNNLLVQNPVGIQVGSTSSQATGNVILDGNDQLAFHSGVGIDVIALPSVRVSGNIIAHDDSLTAAGSAGIQLESGTQQALVTSNIVYNWPRAILNDATLRVNIRDNDLQNPGMDSLVIDQRRTSDAGLYHYSNNTYASGAKRFNRITGSNQSFNDWQDNAGESGAKLQTIDYIAPTRSMASYNASIGGRGKLKAWIFAIRNQSASAWDRRYTSAAAINYIRDGFAHA
jgi:nitrous oxidase accessory protein NosD